MAKRRMKKGGSMFGALAVSSALVAGTLTAAPAADATCFSAFGLNNGNGCLSNLFTIAIGVGEGAQANALTGFFSSAVAIGNGASATAALSLFSSATAFGDGAIAAQLSSIFGATTQMGPGSSSSVGGPNFVLGIGGTGGYPTAAAIGGFNLVVQMGPGTSSAVGGANIVLAGSPWGTGAQNTVAGLFGSVSLNLLGNSAAIAQGFLALAINILDFRVWPFQPFVDLVNAFAEGVRYILRIIGFPVAGVLPFPAVPLISTAAPEDPSASFAALGTTVESVEGGPGAGPEAPLTPDVPLTTETPLTPDVPLTTETPLTPELPVTAEKPLDPEVPLTAETPLDPEGQDPGAIDETGADAGDDKITDEITDDVTDPIDDGTSEVNNDPSTSPGTVGNEKSPTTTTGVKESTESHDADEAAA